MAERHPVADLLTDEMRERVRAARFEQYVNPIFGPVGVRSSTEDRCVCPLAAAVNLPNSNIGGVLSRLKSLRSRRRMEIINNFVVWADDPKSDPADVYVMLGCEPPDGAS